MTTPSQDQVWNNGERQASPTLDGIRADHKARYRFALPWIPAGARVLDAACGIGYGTRMIADGTRAKRVLGIDISENAIEYGKTHYGQDKRCAIRMADCLQIPLADAGQDVVVSFETLEHLDAPLFLKEVHRLLKPGGVLIASTPNEDILPWSPGFTHHLRHYRPAEFVELLRAAGFAFVVAASNEGRESDQIIPGWAGPFNIAVARRL